MRKILLLFALFATIFSTKAQVTFNHTGGFQSYTVPAGTISICVSLTGGQGRANAQNLNLGGRGGEVTGNLVVTPGQVLRIYVGGGGGSSLAGGFNGGGNAGTQPGCLIAQAGGGGGASDIRVAPYGLANRVAVAGGGGGTGGNRSVGCSPGTGAGGGGGYYGGGGGAAYGNRFGQGGTQVAGGAGGIVVSCPLFPQPGANGTLGNGGNGGGLTGVNNQAANNPGCTGGAGGAATGGNGALCNGGNGCPSTWAGAAGGGGSNYTGGLTGTSTVQGVRAGNGQVILTCMILPITLLEFTAEYEKDKGVDLHWTTESEINNRLFTVEKSTDAIDWETVTTLDGANNSNTVINYNSFDAFPYSGTSYYRLKQTDYDEAFTYSSVVAVDITPDYTVNIFPNPSKGNITLNYSTNSLEKVTAKIIDLSGNEVANYSFDQVQEGMNNYKIATSTLATGMYFIQVNNAKKTFYLKFIKE